MPGEVIDNEKMSGYFIATLIWLSVIAAMVTNIQPIYLGALAETFSLTGRQLGFVSGAELGGACLASLSAVYWFPRVQLRKVAFFAITVGLVGNLTTSWVTDYLQLLMVRFLTGFLGSGVLYTLILGLLGRLNNPDRIFAIMIVFQVIALSVGMAGVPVLMDHWQLSGVTMSAALLFATGYFLLHLLPERASVQIDKQAAPGGFSFLPVALMVTLIVFCTGLGGLWAFMERIGSSAGYTMSDIGNALAVSSLVGGLGALAAAALGVRLGRLLPVAFALTLEIVVCLLLATRSDWYSYLLAIALFNFSWNLALPYLLGTIAIADSSGRFIVLIPAAQTAGFALGPVLVGLTLVGDGFEAAAWVSMVMFLLCFVMVVPLLRKIPLATAS